MLRAFIRWPDGNVTRETDVPTLHRAVHANDDTRLWLDMLNPTDDEYELLSEVFQFHELAIEDSINYAQRPKIERYASDDEGHDAENPHVYYYMVFHGPDLETFREKLRMKELDVFLSERFLVTIHDERFFSVDDIVKRVADDARRSMASGIDVLLYRILDQMTDHYRPILEYLGTALEDLEEQAVDKPRPELLSLISAKKKELLDLRRTVGPQREVVAQLTRGEVPFIRESTRVYFRDVQDHLIRVVEMVELYRDLVIGVRDLYLSTISLQLNQVMKTLAIISVIGLPLTVITGMFGMNFDAIPGLHSPAGFWFSLLFMGAAVGLMLFFFWKKRWI